jgi:Mg/Co/Ni transporter MgtE
LARLFTAPGATPLKDLAVDNQISVDVEEKQDRITETFDKYNLLALPVVDASGRLAGAITADEVISLLRHR